MKKLLLLLLAVSLSGAPNNPINNLVVQTAGTAQTGLLQGNGATATAAADLTAATAAGNVTITAKTGLDFTLATLDGNNDVRLDPHGTGFSRFLTASGDGVNVSSTGLIMNGALVGSAFNTNIPGETADADLTGSNGLGLLGQFKQNYSGLTLPSGGSLPNFFFVSGAPHVDGTSSLQALRAWAEVTGSNDATTITGLIATANNNGSGTITTLSGILGVVRSYSSGTTLTAYGVGSTPIIRGSGNINNMIGVYVAPPIYSSTGRIVEDSYGFLFADQNTTNSVDEIYGVDIRDQTKGRGVAASYRGRMVAATDKWNLYIDGSAQNYLAGNTGIGVSVPLAQFHTVGAVRLQYGVGAVLVGADAGLDTLTDSTDHVGRLSVPHYTLTEEPAATVYGTTTSTENRIAVGGGSVVMNAATTVDFYTAANTTTIVGTRRGGFNSAGDLDLTQRLFVNSTAAATTEQLLAKQTTSASYASANWNSATTGDNAFISFGTEGSYTERGSITYNRAGGLVAYNTTSDSRIKENFSLATDADVIDQIRVGPYNLIENGTRIPYGVLAQELYQVYPLAVTPGDSTPLQTRQWLARKVRQGERLNRNIAARKAHALAVEEYRKAKSPIEIEIQARKAELDRLKAPVESDDLPTVSVEGVAEAKPMERKADSPEKVALIDAHEIALTQKEAELAAIPEPAALVEEHDPEDDLPDPKLWAVDYSKLVPPLIAHAQASRRRIETLEATVTALEKRLAALEAKLDGGR